MLPSRVPLTGSALGWATAIGEMLVMVVMVAAGNISVDMSMLRINLIVTGSDHQYSAGKGWGFEFLLKASLFKRNFSSTSVLQQIFE